MEITEVKVFPVAEEKLKAFVSVVFDRCFMVNDIKIIQGRQGLFMSMPSRKKKNGEFKDVAHPLNNETRQKIEGQVLAEYHRILEERGGEPSPRQSRKAAATRKGKADGEAPTGKPADAGGRGMEQGETGPAPGRDSEETNDSGEESAARDQSSTARPQEDAPPDAPEVSDEEGPEEKTLEEVEEMHLRESFWTVP